MSRKEEKELTKKEKDMLAWTYATLILQDSKC